MNAMAVSWIMPASYDPPRIVCVLGESATRRMIDRSRELTVSIPTRAMLPLTYTLGTTSKGDAEGCKLERLGAAYDRADHVAGPLLHGCVGWLECRVLSDPALATAHDLYVAEVVAAWCDDEVFVEGKYVFSDDDRRTIHHVAGGAFYLAGSLVETTEKG